jgi:hypothetical protein
MAGGGSSSREAIAREGKKLKQQEENQRAGDEEKGANPLDPRFSDYDPKHGEYVLTRFRHRTLDLDMECTFSFPFISTRFSLAGLSNLGY